MCLVGLDIVSYSIPVNETAEQFVKNFSSYFSSLEWYHISNAGSSDEMLKIFYRCVNLPWLFVVLVTLAKILIAHNFYKNPAFNIQIEVSFML